MCTTTSHWATHYSTECSKNGSGECDGYCIEHGDFCTCPCHNDLNLPWTIEGVKDYHDEFWGVGQHAVHDHRPVTTTTWSLEDHLNWIKREADVTRYLNEVKLNVMLSTFESRIGLKTHAHTLDIVTTNEKFRKMGVIS